MEKESKREDDSLCFFSRSIPAHIRGHHCAQPLMAALNVIASSRASVSLINNDEDIDALFKGLAVVREALL